MKIISARAYPQDTLFLCSSVCVEENKREEGEEREREMLADLLKSVFLLQAAGRQVGGGGGENRVMGREVGGEG